jgi:hypothetical protein
VTVLALENDDFGAMVSSSREGERYKGMGGVNGDREVLIRLNEG